MSEEVKNIEKPEQENVVKEAQKKRNAPQRLSDLRESRNGALFESFICLVSLAGTGAVLNFTLGVAFAIGAAITFGIVAINEGITSMIYQSKVRKMAKKYPELAKMNKEELMQESKKRELAYMKWNELGDKKTEVPYEEYLKNETGESETEIKLRELLLGEKPETKKEPVTVVKNPEEVKAEQKETKEDEDDLVF